VRIYISLNISRTSYLNIENPENPVEVIGSMYVPENSYEKIIDNLSKYNKKYLIHMY